MPTQVTIPEDLLVFNGIDGRTGQYLIAPMSAQRLVSVIRDERKDWDADHFSDLKDRDERERLGTYAIEEGKDPSDLAQSGWGVVFPAALDGSTADALREALRELLEHRKKQARGSYEEGGLYREFTGPDGYRRGESTKKWLNRLGTDLGTVNPAKGIPYYVLIVGDPNSIPYTFQYELDVDRAVGRIFFETLDEYASYARSVVAAETGKVARSPRAAFFGVTNPDDRATQLSTQYLIQPLAERFEKAKQKNSPDFVKEIDSWQFESVRGDKATKECLLKLMGGDQSPALLFTASHGMGFSPGDVEQLEYQGALLCQDWGGPYGGGVRRDDYLAGEDVKDDACVLGMIDFHFACYGAGTPYYDDFYRRLNRTRSPIAPYAFLAKLPRRLLGHPKGGALAVVGHVERAWTHSFKWSTSAEQTTSFYSTLLRLMRGMPVGHALEYMNGRYASISVQLNNTLENWEFDQDTNLLADLWTGNNDARGYAIIGDPAVKLAVAANDEQVIDRGTIELVPHRTGALPPILDAKSKPGAAVE